jgi:hypothetical protein
MPGLSIKIPQMTRIQKRAERESVELGSEIKPVAENTPNSPDAILSPLSHQLRQASVHAAQHAARARAAPVFGLRTNSHGSTESRESDGVSEHINLGAVRIKRKPTVHEFRNSPVARQRSAQKVVENAADEYAANRNYIESAVNPIRRTRKNKSKGKRNVRSRKAKKWSRKNQQSSR